MSLKKTAIVCASAALLAAGSALLFAQTPNLAGTWKLDSERSQVSAAVLAGLIRAGTPGILHVTQPANGTLLIESEINESHARLYKPGGTSRTPVGPTGSITMTSRWEVRALVSEGSLESTSAAAVAVKEVFTLSDDSATLTIEVATTGSGDPSTTKLVYTRTHVVAPCKNWPTPCKF